eukprot:TRINITY_DN8490_c0_g1_i5.p1 TRINITY_DN8490_c0_g1~~TRINITY_DN8490_c0_g1_i5.p1  ORF type:complete len:151 (-),score=33.24 TRINITY_DN8490_c0_g1_i5:327-779(-)
MGQCIATEDDFGSEYDYDTAKAAQDEKERQLEDRKQKAKLKAELAAMRREEMRESAFPLEFTIKRTDTGEQFQIKTFGYETVAVLKNRLEESCHNTPILYEPQLEYQGKTLADGRTFKELQVRDRAILKLHINEIGGKSKPSRKAPPRRV